MRRATGPDRRPVDRRPVDRRPANRRLVAGDATISLFWVTIPAGGAAEITFRR